jgi:ferredoxin
MVLPLLETAREQSATFQLMPKNGSGFAGGPHRSTAIQSVVTTRIPERPPEEGEQYRFHFDMTKCIGCKCCVVACNEQNGNPAEISWRRVGEIDGGWYPNAPLLHLSMGCNHCLEPTVWLAVLWTHTRKTQNRSGDSQRGYLHRMSVLHVELFPRSSPIQSRTRCRWQMRYVPQPAGGGARTSMRGSVPGEGNTNRNCESPSGSAIIRRVRMHRGFPRLPIVYLRPVSPSRRTYLPTREEQI